MKCRAIVPPSDAGCGTEPVTHRVTFKDGDRVLVCEPCALRYEQMAAAHGTTVKKEKLEVPL